MVTAPGAFAARRRAEVHAAATGPRPSYWRTFRGRRVTQNLAGDAVHLDGCPVIPREFACLPWPVMDGQPPAAVREATAIDPHLTLCAVCWRATPTALPGATVTELVLPTRTAAPSPLTFDQQLVFADKMAASTSLPEAYRNNPGNLLYAAQMADMFGVHPITVIRYADFVEGKLTPGADFQIALVRAAGHHATIKSTGEGDSLRAVCVIVRGDDGERTEVVWTMEDAKRANLAGKPPWRAYPRRMLKHRAVTEAISDACSEVLMGIALPGDLDPTAAMLGVDEDDVADAELVDETPAAPPAPARKPAALFPLVWAEGKRLFPDLADDELTAELESDFALTYDGVALRSGTSEQLEAYLASLTARVAPKAGR